MNKAEIQRNNLCIALKYGLINWFQYFELMRKVQDE